MNLGFHQPPIIHIRHRVELHKNAKAVTGHVDNTSQFGIEFIEQTSSSIDLLLCPMFGPGPDVLG